MSKQIEALKLALDYLESRGLAWNVQIALREALRENAMREVQRLGQEIEQEPVAIRLSNGVIDILGTAIVPIGALLYTTPPQRTEQEPVCPDCKAKVLYECVACSSNNYPPKTEQEPVAYLVLFEGAGKLLEFKKGNYIHGAKVEHIPLYAKPQIEVGCAECGVNGGHALYCVACAEKFVGGYKDSGVPAVETGLEQVSPDTPPQRTWVGLTNNELQPIADEYRILFGSWVEDFARAIEAKLKQKNMENT